MKNVIYFALCSFVLAGCCKCPQLGADGAGGNPFGHALGVRPFVERDGLLVVEIESAPLADGWRLETEMAGYSGDGYYTWRGPNRFGEPGTGVLAYPVRITTPGRYSFRLHNRHDEPDHTECNDVYVRLGGDEWVKVFSHKAGEWNWVSRKDFGHNSPKPNATYDLLAGDHTFYLSGRSANFSIDRFHLYLEDVPDPRNVAHPQSPRAK